MSFHFTTAELAFLVPAGVVLGAVVALIGQRLTNNANLQRSRSERLWDHRADLYLRIVRSVRSYTRMLQTPQVHIDTLEDLGRFADKVELHVEQVSDLSDECAVFGSQSALTALTRYTKANVDLLRRLVAELKKDLDDWPKDASVIAADLVTVDNSVSELLLSIRNDINDDSLGSRRRPSFLTADH